MKFRYIFIVGMLFAAIGAYITNGTPALGQQNSTVSTLNPFKVISGYILPRTATNGLQINSLVSCDTIDTDGDGKFVCGTDDGGMGASDWVDATTYLYPIGGRYVSAPYFVGTSTTATSTFVYASTTRLFVTDAWLGTVRSGTWNGGSIADAYIDDSITASNYVPYTGATGNVDLGAYSLTAASSTVNRASAGFFTATTTTASILPYASTTAVSATTFYGNLTGTSTGNLISGGTLTSAYHCRWDGTGIDCDRVEDASGACAANSVCMGGHIHFGVDEVYASGWNADTDTPEKDDVYDWGHLFDTDDDGKVNVVDTGYGFLVASSTGAVTATSAPTVNYIVATSTAISSAFPLLSVTNTFQIPSGATVYTNSTGSMAIDTTTGQLRWNTGSATSTINGYMSQGFTFASSTLDYMGDYGASGTTTVKRAGMKWAATVSEIYCKSDNTSTTTLRVGNGTASSTTMACSRAGATDTTAIAFTARQDIVFDFGTTSGTPNNVLVDITYMWTAD